MRRFYIPLLALAGGLLPLGADDEVVFHSDVSLVRVDTQVLDRDNRAITGLNVEDFILLENGKPQEIRNFANENMPVDVLLLLDVSGSMRPHVERIASAAHQALRVLSERDRVAIMVFDRSARLRLPFRSSRDDIERAFESLLRQESFNGGTDITQGMLEAAHYVWREARPDARRAIVILTDDETEFERNEAKVGQALAKADAVMSALIAPDAMRYGGMPGGGMPGGGGRRRGGSGGSWPGGGGGSTWPGSSGPLGGPLGGIILGGPRGGYGGPRGGPGGPGSGPVMVGPRTHSAGTSEIARQSGGDSMPVEDASSLETTLERIRQRYALHYHLPDGLKPGQDRNIEVQLSDAARRRYPGAEIRFRRINQAQGGTGTPEPTVITRVPSSPSAPSVARDASENSAAKSPGSRRRTAISEPDGPRGANASTDVDRQEASTQAPADQAPAAAPTNAAPAPPTRGWRRVDEPAPASPNPPAK